MADVIAFLRRPEPTTARLRPPSGRQLQLSDVTGEWHPSCGIEACCVFAVVWSTPDGSTHWAPLHDFTLAAQQRLIDACRRSFVAPDDPILWPHTRCAE